MLEVEGNASKKNGDHTVGFLFHHNATAHRSVLVKDVLAKNIARHALYSLGPASSDFYMFR